MAQKQLSITWTEEFDELAGRVIERYEDQMHEMNIPAYLSDDRQQINIGGLMEFLMRLAAEETEAETELEARFRQSWHQAMTGQTRPIEALWEELDED